MIGAAELARAAREASGYLSAQPDVTESEVFVAANGQLLARLNYTSHIPCNGVEEPKSIESYGLGIQAVFRTADGLRIGFGSEPSDLTLDGVRRALAKAQAGAVRDPTFSSLPKPGPERRSLRDYHDPRLLEITDGELVDAGWKAVSGALRTFLASRPLAELAGSAERIQRLGLILGGDVTILQERIAVASTHFPSVETDESTLITASLTAMVEQTGAKGSGWTTGTRLDHFTDEAGGEAAQSAVRGVGGARVPSGTYTVIFGPQPVADLLDNIVLPALHASSFYAANTPFLGRWGKPVASPRLSLFDHGALPGFMGSKGITCEGLPTGRTDLITRGILTGLLTNWYEAQRLLRDPEARAKLGVEPADAARGVVSRNGFRFAAGGGRHFTTPPGIAATNVFVEGAETTALEELVRRIENGLYVGRIWYTYPINGLKAGDFTCTVVGDSYVIRDGRTVAPLKANTVRINDNIATFLNNIVGISKQAKGTLLWAADEAVYAPDIAVSGVTIDEIARFTETL
ncbi:MAG: TldD/PmbA family protein [Candidatus Rokubacteria bacterium]|nr:TldD/PmbA family protein [Candidatus Rokubacteria bacterium]